MIHLKYEYFGLKSKDNFERLSKYCSVAKHPINYAGYIDIDNKAHRNLIFKNIVYATYVNTRNLANNFPDLMSASTVTYNISPLIDKYPVDIGNLESVRYFYFSFNNDYPIPDFEFACKYFKLFVDIIDETTLIINGKKLIVEQFWGFFNDEITILNYKNIF